MAHPTNTQFLCFWIVFFLVVGIWQVVSWLRIARLVALGADNLYDPEVPRIIVLGAVLEDKKIVSHV